MASNELTDLDYIRIAKERGLLDKLSPSQRAIIAKRLEVPMQEEREEALKTQAELAVTPPKTSFMQDLVSGFQAIKENPGAAVHNAVRGVERSFNPLPMANLINKANPFSDGDIPEDLETMESALNFPIIRGAELAARMFVPKDQRPSLTTFAQVVNNQREMDQQLRSITPGVQEGAELGSAAVGLIQLGSTGLKVAHQVARRAPGAVKQLAANVSAKRAAIAKSKTARLSETLIREGDGPILDAIRNRPERVEALVNQTGDLSVNDLAMKIKDDLENIAGSLGERVGEFRQAAFSDHRTRIKIPETISQNIKILRERTRFQVPEKFITETGEVAYSALDVLPADIVKKLRASEKAANLGVSNPNQVMVWVDMLDDIIDYGNSGKQGSNIVKSSNNTLMAIRGQLKDALRANTKDGERWAQADDLFSGYLDASDGLIRKLESDSSESLIANLFTKNKTPLRDRLEVALNYMEKIDPLSIGHGNAFFSRLNDVRAAQKIKDVQKQVNRVNQEGTHEIVRRWTKRGERVGTALGAIGGSLSGMLGGGGLSGGAVGGGVGGWAMRSMGAEAGEIIGTKLADPMRILNAAKKSKNLSLSAQRLANDVGTLITQHGPEASIAFFDLVGPIPAVNELIKFANSREIRDNSSEKKGVGK